MLKYGSGSSGVSGCIICQCYCYQVTTRHQHWSESSSSSGGFYPLKSGIPETSPACTTLYHHLTTFINQFWPCLQFQSSAWVTRRAGNKITPHLIPFFFPPSSSKLFLSRSGASASRLPQKNSFCSLGAFTSEDNDPADKNWEMYIKYARQCETKIAQAPKAWMTNTQLSAVYLVGNYF